MGEWKEMEQWEKWERKVGGNCSINTIGSGRIRSNDNIGRGFSYFHPAHGIKPGIDGYVVIARSIPYMAVKILVIIERGKE